MMIPSIQCSMFGRTTSIPPKSADSVFFNGSSGSRKPYVLLHRLMNFRHCSNRFVKGTVCHESQLSSYNCSSPSTSLAPAASLMDGTSSPPEPSSMSKFADPAASPTAPREIPPTIALDSPMPAAAPPPRPTEPNGTW
eukprot:1732427-Rhodomonas_salina.5